MRDQPRPQQQQRRVSFASSSGAPSSSSAHTGLMMQVPADRYDAAVQKAGHLEQENKALRERLEALELKRAAQNQRKRNRAQRQEPAQAQNATNSEASDSSMAAAGEQRAQRRAAVEGVAAAVAAAADSDETADAGAAEPSFKEAVRRGSSRRSSAPPAAPAEIKDSAPSPRRITLQVELLRALQQLPKKTKQGIQNVVREYGPDTSSGGVRLSEVYKALHGKSCTVPEARTSLINMICNAIYNDWDDLVTKDA